MFYAPFTGCVLLKHFIFYLLMGETFHERFKKQKSDLYSLKRLMKIVYKELHLFKLNGFF